MSALHSEALPSRRLLVWCGLPSILLAVWYHAAAWQMAGVIGFPLDDAWIHAQFARNIATGHGFSYTGDRWIAGSTSPAWTLLLAAGYLLTRSVLISTNLLGIALQIISGVLAARLTYILVERRDLAIGAGLMVVASPAMAWGAVSGMELGLASALVLAAFYSYLSPRHHKLRAVALFAVASLARPETLVVLGLCIGHLLLSTRPWSSVWGRAAQVALILAVVLGPFVAFDYLTTGRPLPTTFYAKSGPGLVRALAEGDMTLAQRLVLTTGPNAVLQLGATVVDQFGLASVVVFAGYVIAWVGGARRHGAALIAGAVLIGAYSMGLIAPMRLKPENFRYTAQMLCLSPVLGATALSLCWPLIPSRSSRVAIIALLVASVSYLSIRDARDYALSVRNIDRLQVALGRWMRYALPADARVAVNDIGAAAFFSRRELIDLEGLVSPEALAYPRKVRGIGFVTDSRPDFIAIFPFWYPDIASRSDLFHEVHRESVAEKIVSAGDTIVVYDTPWTRGRIFAGPVSPRRQRWPD